MSDVLVPGGRDVRATLDEPAAGADAAVVACPPHPRHGGTRSDRRLVAVSKRLVDRGIACLRLDYGEWDEGYGEREDVRNAIRWAAARYDRIGVFGYSFGASQAILASATVDEPVAAVSALAPATRLADEGDLAVLPTLEEFDAPVQVVYGDRDVTVDWEPVVERAEELGHEVVELSADHFFVGQHATVAETVGDFLGPLLE